MGNKCGGMEGWMAEGGGGEGVGIVPSEDCIQCTVKQGRARRWLLRAAANLQWGKRR